MEVIAMPQLKFWADEHECRFVAEYVFDPTAPHRPVKLAVRVHRQDGRVTASRSIDLPPGFEDHAWPDVVADAFRAWIVADGRAAIASVTRNGRAWRQAAEQSAQTR